MKFKKSQSGRSMVEMLGVLAIIGVLSVGGIAGYSHSMSKHRANRIADVVAKYAAIAYGQCQKIILDGYFDNYEIENMIDEELKYKTYIYKKNYFKEEIMKINNGSEA